MKIGFIGCGNMGGALATAISATPDAEVFVFDFDDNKTCTLNKKCGCIPTTPEALGQTCEFIFLGVKPAAISAAIDGISTQLTKNKNAVIISMAAGVSIEKIENSLPCPHPVIRIMPNTPVSVGMGVTVYSTNALVDEKTEKAFLHIMSHTGLVDKIPEELIDSACAVSGCGPAFAYMFAKALADGGAECGLSYDKAMLYATEMISGAMEMIKRTGKAPEQLKNEVCSPGGSTIEGVHALEDGAFHSTCSDAVVAAYEKTKKLG